MDTARQRILQFIERHGIRASEFLENTGLKRGFIDKSHIKSGATDIHLSKILENYPQLSAEWLLTGNGSMTNNRNRDETPDRVFKLRTDRDIDHQTIPLFNLNATAGLAALFANCSQETPEGQISIPNLPKCDGSTYISGDSMHPLLKAGDIIAYQIVNDQQNDIFWGEMYLMAISTSGEDFVTVKYVHRSDKGDKYFKLVSENEAHPPQDIQRSKLRAIAHVKATIRYNSMN